MSEPVFAVILNWNSAEDTLDCVKSLQAGQLKPERIIVVDNGSQDNSVQCLQEWFKDAEDVSILVNKANLGFAKGANVGIMCALEQGATHVLLVNDDAVVAPDCLERLMGAIKTHPSVGLAAPRIFFHVIPDKVWQGGGHFSRVKAGVIVPEKNKREADLSPEIRSVTFASGCVLLIHRDVFEAVGLLDEDFYFYEEDAALCLQAQKYGFGVLYVPTARAWHKIADVAQDRTSPFVLYHLARSRVLLLRKNFRGAYMLYGLLTHLVLFSPFRIYQVLRGSQDVESIRAWFGGTWRGLRDPVHKPPRSPLKHPEEPKIAREV